ncbi:phosphatidylinositol-4-phosphate 5-kinase 8-like [Hibiscus syriacus]|uniref:Phosphatidylinositol-4-phosphate 5-kinase 8-like n=1 Tax=Hibiscus syriacus TaxID=106335 RepID=A0A6A2ZN70_HIBSY|nr:RNA demethylase ALKBH9B-like [Hibiscus syriacus]KAE8692612.1 phosphatidylinositol-4-phosphate 5-kinase 8-like [Hibiscus syriacus]
MAGDIPGKSPASNAGHGQGVVGLLKTINRDEAFEALSQGFCQHCEAVLDKRIHQILSGRGSETSLSNGEANVASNATPAPDSAVHCTLTPEANFDILLNDGLGGTVVDNGLSEEQKERIRFSLVGRKKDFIHTERVNGRPTNVLKGLELHTKVFNAKEQSRIMDCVYDLQRMGQKGQLRERTYTEPRKWMRGKGRVTIQFGCCYNYAVDKNGNPPGIIRDEEVDPLPQLFKQMIKRMVRWHILPPTCIPNSCIVNIYDEGDCIPPHIDHHDFLRPFCTVSFLTQCNILFGLSLKIASPGEFSGPVSIPLPVGSVLILNGNGADVAKHCVPAVPGKRISITFRRMDDSKLPYQFSPDPELLRIKPLVVSPTANSAPRGHHQKPIINSSFVKAIIQQNQHRNGQVIKDKPDRETSKTMNDSFLSGKDDFPPLSEANKAGSRR